MKMEGTGGGDDGSYASVLRPALAQPMAVERPLLEWKVSISAYPQRQCLCVNIMPGAYRTHELWLRNGEDKGGSVAVD
jgi:hypothetical protein